jgi:hypothetical protein
MTEYLPVKVGDIVERSELRRLRPETIVKGEAPENPPLIVKGGDDIEARGTLVDYRDVHAERLRVLWVPPVPAPQVGEKLTLEQLDALPRWSVVQMADPTDHSTFQLIREANSSVIEMWVGWMFETDSHTLWQHTRGNLTLLWLPETAKG